MVVPPRSTSAMIPRPGASRIEEVRSCLDDEAALRSQNNLFAEAELLPEQESEVILDRLAHRTMHVDRGDRFTGLIDVSHQATGHLVTSSISPARAGGMAALTCRVYPSTQRSFAARTGGQASWVFPHQSPRALGWEARMGSLPDMTETAG